MKTRADIIDYASERGIGQRGNSAVKIAEILGSIDYFGQDGFKKRAMEVIIDAQERGKRNKNPKMIGYLKGEKYSNPRKYLNVIESELKTRIQQEETFLRDFVDSNDSLSDETKAFLRLQVSAIVGPWNADNHVTAVTENNGQIIIQHQNGETYYYLEQDIDQFVKQFIVNSDLSEETKAFLENLVRNEQGPWSSRGNVNSISESNGKITMGLRSGEAYYYMEQ